MSQVTRAMPIRDILPSAMTSSLIHFLVPITMSNASDCMIIHTVYCSKLPKVSENLPCYV